MKYTFIPMNHGDDTKTFFVGIHGELTPDEFIAKIKRKNQLVYK